MGGGFNSQRLRPEFGVGLCPCDCHSPCPVTVATKRVTVPLKTWYTTCTCPGADGERHSLDEAGLEVGDFSEVWQDARRRARARKEAFAAARARAAGKSRAEIRDIYVEELRARGLKVPADRILDATVEHITGNPVPAVRLGAEGLAQMGKAMREAARLFRQ